MTPLWIGHEYFSWPQLQWYSFDLSLSCHKELLLTKIVFWQCHEYLPLTSSTVNHLRCFLNMSWSVITLSCRFSWTFYISWTLSLISSIITTNTILKLWLQRVYFSNESCKTIIHCSASLPWVTILSSLKHP